MNQTLMVYTSFFLITERVNIQHLKARFLNHIESYGFLAKFQKIMVRAYLPNGFTSNLNSKKDGERPYGRLLNHRCFFRKLGFRLESP